MGSKWQTFVDQQHEKARSYPNALWVLFATLGLVNVLNGLTGPDRWFDWLFLAGGVLMLCSSVLFFRWGQEVRAERSDGS